MCLEYTKEQTEIKVLANKQKEYTKNINIKLMKVKHLMVIQNKINGILISGWHWVLNTEGQSFH